MQLKKSIPHSERINYASSFSRIRPTWQELAHASRAAKLIRIVCCCGPLPMKKSVWRTGALVKEIIQQVLPADTTNKRGDRNVMTGDLHKLQGFEFEKDVSWHDIAPIAYTTDIDRDEGKITISFSSFTPADVIKAPAGATHFQLAALGAALDFASSNAFMDTHRSAGIPLTKVPSGAITLNLKLLPKDTAPIFLVLGIIFYQKKRGKTNYLFDGTSVAACLVQIDTLTPKQISA